MLLWFAARDPECPRFIRWLALALVAYALSPIDLIPDFIPVLGWLDELVILPLGLAWLLRRLPPAVRARAAAKAADSQLPRLAQGADGLARWWRRGLLLLLVVWLALLMLVVGLVMLWWP